MPATGESGRARWSYERPIYPKNLYLDRAPMKHAEYREKVIEPQIQPMHERGTWARPAQ